MVRDRWRLGAAALILCVARPAVGQGPAVPAPASVPAAAPEQTVEAAREILQAQYVLPDVASELDRALGRAASAGAFRGLSGNALAARIDAELRAVTSDAHLQVRFDPRLAQLLSAAPSSQPTPAQGWDAALAARLRNANAGVRKLELLPGNIRYLAYDSFGWGTPGAQEALATAMAFLRNGDAIIIDLRNNAGGSTYAEAAMASYFLPPATPLTRFEMRNLPGETTATSPAPFSLSGTPTYVLIGPATVSAAEGFAQHAQLFGFATLVGERTRGGGYTVRAVPLPGGFVLGVSVGRAVDALTGVGVEGTGIAPAIAVAADKALAAAQGAAMEHLLSRMSGPERDRGERLLAFYRAQVEPPAAALPLETYQGRFGDFTVGIEDGELSARFGQLAAERLVALGGNLFAAHSDPTTQLRFIAEGSSVTALELDSGNGPPARIGRTAQGGAP